MLVFVVGVCVFFFQFRFVNDAKWVSLERGLMKKIAQRSVHGYWLEPSQCIVNLFFKNGFTCERTIQSEKNCWGHIEYGRIVWDDGDVWTRYVNTHTTKQTCVINVAFGSNSLGIF